MREANGERAVSFIVEPLQVNFDGTFIWPLENAYNLVAEALGKIRVCLKCGQRLGSGFVPPRILLIVLNGNTLIDLNDALIQHVGPDDVEVEELGARLVADEQCVREALGHDQRHPLALSFEESVSGHRGPHADAKFVQPGDVKLLSSRKRPAGCLLQDPPDRFDGGVIVVGRVLRQQLHDNAVLPAINYTKCIRESAPSILIFVDLLAGHRSHCYMYVVCVTVSWICAGLTNGDLYS